MSSNLAHSAAEQWAPQTDQRHLEAVSPLSRRRARPRTAYALIAVGTLVAIVVAQLLLSVLVSQGAFRIDSLKSTQTNLQRSYQQVAEDLHRVSSPQNLAANAEALGMVSNASPVYLRLSDGAVLGTPEPASSDTGTVTAGAGQLVPNSLLAGVPLVTGQPKPGQSPAATNPAAPSASTPTPASTPVPLDGALPAPTTH